MLQLQILRNQGLGRCPLDRRACCIACGPQIPRALSKLGMVAHICKPEARRRVGTGKPQGLGCGLPESPETPATQGAPLRANSVLLGCGGMLRLSAPSTFCFRKADLRSERHVRAGVRQHSVLNHRHLQPLRRELPESWKSLCLLFYLLPSVSTHPSITGTKMFSEEDKAGTGNCHPFSCSHTMVLQWGSGSGWTAELSGYSLSKPRMTFGVGTALALAQSTKTTRHRTVRGLEMTQALQESVIVSKKKIKYFSITAWLVHVMVHARTIQKVDKLTRSQPKHPRDSDSNFWLKRKAPPVSGGIATYMRVIGTENGVVCFFVKPNTFLLSSS